ncbi:hypothetical protein DFJ73DRAFT_622493 [Zopfochytrium polystomum]|nr:hypothetical protein DFJ73DRAFT_622493 [Zopfochytrium polystomum]
MAHQVLLPVPIESTFRGAHCLWWPVQSVVSNSSPPAPPRWLVVFVAGNPGLAEYYRPFLSALHSSTLLRGSVEIVALSLRGHAPTIDTRDDGMAQTDMPWDAAKDVRSAIRGIDTSLRAQADHKLAALTSLRSLYPPGSSTQMIVMGHSIGCYILLDAIGSSPTPSTLVDGVIMLMPALAHLRDTPAGKRLTPVVLRPTIVKFIVPAVIFLLSLMPTVFLVALIRVITRQPPAGAAVTAKLVAGPRTALNALSMGLEEMATVHEVREDMRKTVRALAERRRAEGPRRAAVRAYFAAGDIDEWVPQWIRESVEDGLGLQTFHLPPSSLQLKAMGDGHDVSLQNEDANEDDASASPAHNSDAAVLLGSAVCQWGLKHAFCLDPSETNTLAAVVARWIHDW